MAAARPDRVHEGVNILYRRRGLVVMGDRRRLLVFIGRLVFSLLVSEMLFFYYIYSYGLLLSGLCFEKHGSMGCTIYGFSHSFFYYYFRLS